MAFIICKKTSRGGQQTELYYLVENFRDGGKIKRRTLLHMLESNSLEEFLMLTEKREVILIEELRLRIGRLEAFIKGGRQARNYYWPADKLEADYVRKVKEAKLRLEKCQELKEKIKVYVVPNIP